jgi:hypothetical protein
MNAPLSADQAIALLRQDPAAYDTPAKLRALAAMVDADSAGRLTVLYSGPAAHKLSSAEVIGAMIRGGDDIRVIDNTEIARFLTSDDFLHAAARVHHLSDFEPLLRGTYRGPATDWLYHPTEGPWADASARFADATVGEVRVIASNADPGRTFGAVEVPHLLANPKVTTIEGIPRETLVARQAAYGTQAAFEVVLAKARLHTGMLDVAVNGTGVPLRGATGELMLDSRKYFVGTGVPGHKAEVAAATRPLAELMDPPNTHVLAGQAGLDVLYAGSADDFRLRRTRLRAGAALGVAGLALDLYDAAQTQREAQHLRAQGNDTAADSHLIHFGTRTVGGVTGAGLGLAAGAAAGVQTGPGLLFTGAIGSAVGAFAGEKLADEWDERRIYRQTDREGRTWTFDPDRPGLGWHREAAIDDRDDGLDNARAGIVRAAPALADELDYKATAVSLELKLGAPSVPRDPFAQPAADGDTPSSRPSPWVRDADTGQWTRVVYGPFVERGMTPRHTETATPERAAELDRQAAAIVLENARLAPAALAARYEDAYLRHGWAAHGPMPEAVSRARSDFDTLLGSDGNRYRRGEDGEWRHDGLLSDRIARGNLKHELEATRELLQATLPPRQAHAPLSAAAVPRSEDEAVRDALRGAYAHAGVAVDEKTLSAGTQAVRAALVEHRLAVGDAAVQLRRDGDGRYGPDSGIAILARQPDGELRIVALVRAEDLARARQASEAPAMREPAPPATTPVSPPPMPSDLRDPLHPGHAAYRQSLGHVHRMEASHGIASGPHSEGLAAAVAVAVEREGLRVQRLDLDRASGQVFAVERGPYPEFTERRVPIDTRDALSAGFEAHARQWLLARSPHYADSSAPLPERTPEATAALARLSPQDRALFERIRRDVPAAIADEAVAQAMLEAKRNGIDRAEAVDRTMLVGDRLWVAGNVPGLRASVDLAAPAPPLMQTLQDSHAFDQQHERERAHEAEQRVQSATAHRLMA